MTAIELVGDSGRLRARVNVSRGGEIGRVRWHGNDVLANWSHRLSQDADPELDGSRRVWLESYRGGWQELLPNSGDACEVDGRHYGFHGQASAEAWQMLHAHPDSVTLSWSSPLFGLAATKTVRTESRSARLVTSTTLTNVNPVRSAPVLWGHHPVFALSGPATVVWSCGCPKLAHRSGCEGSVRAAIGTDADSRVQLADVSAGWAELWRNDGLVVRLDWDAALLPHLWLWVEVGPSGWPFPEQVKLVALEPQRASTTEGLAAAIKRGEQLVLSPGESREVTVAISLMRSFVEGEGPRHVA